MVFLIIGVCGILPLLFWYFGILGFFKWKKKLGKKVSTFNCYNIPIYYNTQKRTSFDFDLVATFFKKELVKYKNFLDMDILSGLKISFTENLYGMINNSEKAVGGSEFGYTWDPFTFSKAYFIYLDINTIERRKLEGKFSESTMASLIMHEYLHQYLGYVL